MKILFETKANPVVTAEEVDPPRRTVLEATRRKTPPKLREAAFDDYSQIAALQVRNGLNIRPYADWVAQWRGNPVYEESRGPIGWVLETAEREIVGQIRKALARHEGMTVLDAQRATEIV